MNAYCPECETDLDGNTGICPACRWDPLTATDMRTASAIKTAEMSLTERYRGTAYDLVLQSDAASHQTGVSRGRVLVIVGLIGGAALYGAVLTMMAPF
jgi:hypothetical protein